MPRNNSRCKALAKALRKERNAKIALQIAFDHVSHDLERALDEAKTNKELADKYANKCERYEMDARANARKNLDLQYMEVRGDFPVLWINSPNASVVNHGTYAQIKDILSRLAPNIQSVILTYGDVKLWELTDKDLAKIGLCRIKGHDGGAIGPSRKEIEAGKSGE